MGINAGRNTPSLYAPKPVAEIIRAGKTARPTAPARPLRARVAIGRAAPAADELVPLPPAEFLALAAAVDAL